LSPTKKNQHVIQRSEIDIMSTVSQPQPFPIIRSPHRRQLWWFALICPLLVAPIWLSLPQAVLGPLHGFDGLLLCLLLVGATISDLGQRKIYNWMTYTAFAWAIAINLWPFSWAANIHAIGLMNSLWGATVCFLVMLVPYTLARGGAGDVKLATAIGALVGMDDGLLVIAFAYIISAILILGWTVWNHGPLTLISAMFRRAVANFMPHRVSPPSEQQRLLLDQPIPLAGFFLVARLLIVFDVPAVLGSL
jgi:prepilin peptidase CpaA